MEIERPFYRYGFILATRSAWECPRHFFDRLNRILKGIDMKLAQILVPVAMAALAAASTSAMAAVDADAAQALFKKNDCTKCHSVDKAKKGPALKKVAATYKGKADAQASIIKAITTGPKVKMDDGSQEDHKVIDTKDQAALKNIADWILAQ